MGEGRGEVRRGPSMWHIPSFSHLEQCGPSLLDLAAHRAGGIAASCQSSPGSFAASDVRSP